MKKTLLFGLLVVSLVETAAFALEDTAKKRTRSPDDVICRTEEELGSRLNKRRICMTRAQWDEARRESKNSIDSAQQKRALTSQ